MLASITSRPVSSAAANSSRFNDYTFPFTFTTTVDNIAFEDREIRQLGEQLTSQVSRYMNDLAIFQPGSELMLPAREQIVRTRQQFLKVANNRIQERTTDLGRRQLGDQPEDRTHRRLQAAYPSIAGNPEQAAADGHRDQRPACGVLHLCPAVRRSQHRAFAGQRPVQRPGPEPAVRTNRPGLSQAGMLIIAFGMFSGLLLAIALVYVREFFDHRFKHPAQITQQLDVLVLLVINEQSPDSGQPAPQLEPAQPCPLGAKLNVPLVRPVTAAPCRSFICSTAAASMGPSGCCSIIAWRRSGQHQVLFLAAPPTWITRFRQAGVDCRHCASWAELLQHLRQRRDDRPLINTHNFKGLFLGWSAATLLGLPLVITQHGFTPRSPGQRFYTWLSLQLCRTASGRAGRLRGREHCHAASPGQRAGGKTRRHPQWPASGQLATGPPLCTSNAGGSATSAA